MVAETKALFDELLTQNRPAQELLTASFSYVNARLAAHYGIDATSAIFERVALPAERAGLLGHASILTVTSYATRTSPVIRGKWILENILGTPPPPPPPNVPALEDNDVSADLPIREEEEVALPAGKEATTYVTEEGRAPLRYLTIASSNLPRPTNLRTAGGRWWRGFLHTLNQSFVFGKQH